jgi:HEAT repeat protein
MIGWLRSFLQKRSLRRQVQSTDPQVRQGAAEQLGTVSQPWASEELVRLLADSHAPIREAAKGSLQHHGAAALPVLLGCLNHPDVNVSQAAAELLGELKTAEAVDPLVQALKFSPRPVQLAAKRALQAYGALAVPALMAVREDPQPWVRRQIEEVLEQTGSVPPPNARVDSRAP